MSDHITKVENFDNGVKASCTCGWIDRWPVADGSAQQSASAHKGEGREVTALDEVLVGKVAAAISQVFDRTLAPEQRGRPPMEMDYDAARAVITVCENYMKEETANA